MSYTDSIGVDLGGTKVRAALVQGQKVTKSHTLAVSATAEKDIVINEVMTAIEEIITPTVSVIGVGVPSVVDVEKGIVYDVQNIPSWDQVPLKELLKARYDLPIFIDNDANCFTKGTHKLGVAQGFSQVAGLILGTGAAAGMIINDELYQGSNCGAGEFGMIPYLDHHYEHYCSGQFFQTYFGKSGAQLFEDALGQDSTAIKAFNQFGQHLGHLITTILYSFDPEIIVLGGSVSQAFPWFQKEMWKVLDQFAYKKTISRIQIEVSKNPDIPVLGAAFLGQG